jgi:hypothetical protein
MDEKLEQIKSNLYIQSDGEVIDVAVLEREEMDFIFSSIYYKNKRIKDLEEENKRLKEKKIMKGKEIAQLIYDWVEKNHIHPDDFDMLLARELLENLELDK